MELYKGKNWDIIFGVWCQDHPGYCIIGNDKESLSELTSEAWEELGKLEKELERVCKKVFGATMFNFCCLMNNAYRDNTKPKVHYHFVPRYKDPLMLFNKKYVDRHFGYNFWKWDLSKFKSQKDPYTDEEKRQIFEMMKNEFKVENVKLKNDMEKENIKKLEFEKTNITINETYIDENGHERERQKIIKFPVFDKLDINTLTPIAEKICEEIKKLNIETEFSIQQFIDKHEVEEKDKFALCNLILDYCKNKNIIIVEKITGEYSGLPWNIIRVKKN